MKAAIALITLALAGCATIPPASAGPTAALGEVAYSNGLKVRPLQVLEDSRCPINAVCVWAGRLIVRSEVIGGNWRQMRDIEMGQAQQIADGALTLVSIQPSKQAGAEIDPRAYRFTFDFQGGL
jgi:hypothetical protein